MAGPFACSSTRVTVSKVRHFSPPAKLNGAIVAAEKTALLFRNERRSIIVFHSHDQMTECPTQQPVFNPATTPDIY
ncbi:MAG TPA: hypothetical protein VL051_13660 [Burkholderiaceae bacterium]|nr:hypothetical protein [Burkholderiaceae bacterium]